jgi:protein O-GlcNAc transferase
MGLAQMQMGNIDEAIKEWQKSIAIDNHFVEGYFNIADALVWLGKLTEAIEWYQKTVDLDSRHANAYCNMGNAYYKLQ